MKNKLLELWNNFLTYKKITIPVTVLVVGLAVGGISYGAEQEYSYDIRNSKHY